MSVPDLAYIALAVGDVTLATDVLTRDLGLSRHDVEAPKGNVSAFPVGRTALLVVEAGDEFLTHGERTGVDHIALATADPEGVLEPLGWQGEASPGLGGGRQVVIESGKTAGVALRLAAPLGLAFEKGEHVERVDHIGIASVDNVEAEAIFAGELGFPVESRQTDIEVRTAIESFTSDKYGVVYHTRAPEPVGGLRVSFLSVGDTDLELLQEFDPAQGAHVERGAPGTTKQDQGAVGRYIARHGPGLHHVALKVPDIDRTLAHLAARGRELIDSVGRPGSRRARIGFVHPRSLGGVLLHFVERRDRGLSKGEAGP